MSVVNHYVSSKVQSILFSNAAKNHLLACLKEIPDAVGIRLSLKKSGCSGLSYIVECIEHPVADDVVEPFDSRWQLYIERANLPYLQGILVDYVQQGMNSKLIFNNPNQTGLCGCGESFTVD